MRPGRAFVLFFLLWLAASLVAVLWPRGLEIWGGLTLAWLTLALLDLRAMHRLPVVAAERHIPHSLPLGVWRPGTIRLSNPGKTPITFDVFGSYPKVMDTVGLPRRVTLPGASWAEIPHTIRATQRGKHPLEAMGLSLHSPLRFWRRMVSAGQPSNVRVYPNYTAWKRFSFPGNQFSRRRLRNPQIDTLASDEGTGDASLQVLFLLDCGPRMLTNEGGDMSHLDRCLNAILPAARSAIEQGASVGLMTFTHYLPPQKGHRAFAVLLNTLRILQADTHDTDYVTAATELLTRLRKHSLVVIIGLLGHADKNNLEQASRLLGQRHRVLWVNLREEHEPTPRMRRKLARLPAARVLNTSPKSLSNTLLHGYLHTIPG
jgi:uncharacterized protein (DUF58 family)